MDPTRFVFHVGIVLGLSGSIDADQLTALQSEAAAIWRPYGVELSWFDPNADCGSHSPAEAMPVDWVLRLTTESIESSGAVLGTVRFREGRPGDTIHLLYGPLLRMVLEANLANWSIRLLPAPVRNRLVGQALGRVVAHELGHVLLALPTHDRSGLMRPTFVPADLIARGRDQLRLSKTYAERLDRRLATLISP